jgi:hypothetical protein
VAAEKVRNRALARSPGLGALSCPTQLSACIDAVLDVLQLEQAHRARMYANKLLHGREDGSFAALIMLLVDLRGNNARLAADAAPFSFDNLAGRISQELQDYHDVLPLILLHWEGRVLRENARECARELSQQQQPIASIARPLPQRATTTTTAAAAAASASASASASAAATAPATVPAERAPSMPLHQFAVFGRHLTATAHAAGSDSKPAAHDAELAAQPDKEIEISPADFQAAYWVFSQLPDVFDERDDAADAENSCLSLPAAPDAEWQRAPPALPARSERPVRSDRLPDISGLEDIMSFPDFDALAEEMMDSYHAHSASEAAEAGPVTVAPVAAVARKLIDPQPAAASALPGPYVFTPVVAAPVGAAGWTTAIRGCATPVRELSPQLLRRHGVVTPDGNTPTEGSLLSAAIQNVDALRPLFRSARTLHPAQFPRVIACAPLLK